MKDNLFVKNLMQYTCNFLTNEQYTLSFKSRPV
jgi:hypothetical protein